MGNCFSDVEGGKQAVGGTQQRPNSIAATNNNNGGHNDAVEFFFRSRGIQPLFTQIEVMYVKYKVPKKKKKVRNFFNISLCFYMYNWKSHYIITHTTIFCMCTGCVTVYSVPQFGSKVSPIQSIPIVIEKFWVFCFVLFCM